MKYDIRAYLKFEMYLRPGVGQLSQVKSVNCVKNFSIANKSIMHQRIKYDKFHSLYVYTNRLIFHFKDFFVIVLIIRNDDVFKQFMNWFYHHLSSLYFAKMAW